MENTSHNYVRIENAKFGKRGIVYTSTIFIISFVICIVIGATGPQVIQIRNDGTSTLNFHVDKSAVWNGVLEDMTPLNQMFWLTAQIIPKQTTTSQQVEMTTRLNVTGLSPFDSADKNNKELVASKMKKRTISCPSSHSACQEFYIFGESAIEYGRYEVSIGFEITSTDQTEDTLEVRIDLHTINSEYSKFELGWKCFFLLTTLVVMFLPQEGFMIRLYAIPYRLWSFEQRWITSLLVGLLFFNDPFFAAQLYSPHPDSMAILYIFFTSTFVGMILIFWLCVLDEMRATDESGVGSLDSGRRTPIKFYTPKLILVILIWSILMSSYAYVRTQRTGDPTYEGLDDWVLRDVEIVLAIFLFIYCIYLFTLLVLSFSRIMALSPPFKFIFTITLFVYVSVMTSLFAGYFYPLATSAIVFLSIYSIMNFYVWTLAFAYAPIGTDEGYSKGPSAFGEDYFEGLQDGDVMIGDGTEYDL